MLNSLFVISVIALSLMLVSLMADDGSRDIPYREWNFVEKTGVTAIILLIIVGILNIINYGINS